MAIKFSNPGQQYITAPDAANLTFPNSDWTIGFFFDQNTPVPTNVGEYVFSSNSFGNAQQVNIFRHGEFASGNNYKIEFHAGTVSVPSPVAWTSGWKFVICERRSGYIYTKICDVLANMPTDGSAVVSSAGVAISVALDGAGFKIGTRQDLVAGVRFLNQSLSRIFRYDGVLTTLEIAKLAHGMTLEDLGHTPLWYVPMSTHTDTADTQGTITTTVVAGPLTTQAEPPWGYSAASPVAGDLAATETGQDTASIAGEVAVAGGLTASESGEDAFFATGGSVVTTSGALNAVETGADTATIDGQVAVAGALAATETGADAAALDGQVIVTGDLAANESGVDTLAATGGAPPDLAASLSASETGPDTAAVTGTILVSGAVAASESGSDTAAFIGTVASASQIASTDQTANRIWQRAAGVASLPFSGTYAGTVPSSIEVELYASDGTTVSAAWAALTGATISGGTWSGTLAVPQGGMYRFAARSKDGGDAVLTTGTVSTNLWGVGDLFGLIGSSSTVGWYTSSSGTGFTPNANIRRYSTANTWDAAGTDGTIISFANAWAVEAGVPVGFIEAAVGGTKISQWRNTNDANYLAFLADLTAVGGKLAAVLMHLSSNDAGNGTVISKLDHITGYRAVVSNIRGQTGQAELPFFISGTNRRPGAAYSDQFSIVREVEKDMGSDPNVYYAAQTVDLQVSGDNIHLTAAGYQACMARIQRAVFDVLGAGTFHRGPAITSIVANGTTATVTLSHVAGSDFTPTTGITGFDASDGGGVLSITSAGRSSATEILLTFGRAISGTATIRYLYGVNPVGTGGGVFDNSAGALPLEVETEMAVTVVVTGDLAATETGADTAAFAGQVIVAGDIAATESGADTFAATGGLGITTYGTLAASETGSDTAALAGTVLVAGDLATSETGSDTAALAGTGAVVLSLPAIASTSQTFAPSLVVGSVNVSAPAITATSTPFAPTVVIGAVAVTAPAIAAASNVFAPALVVGSVTVSAPVISVGSQLFAPTISTGAAPTQTLTAPAISAASAVYAASLVKGAVAVAAPAITSTAQVFTPGLVVGAVAVTAPHIGSTVQTFAPSIQTDGSIGLSAPAISSTAQVFAPALVKGAVSVSAAVITTGAQVYAPTVVKGAVALSAPAIASTANLFAPTVLAAPAQTLTLPTLASTLQLFSPEANIGAVDIGLPLLPSSNAFYSMVILGGADPDYAPSAYVARVPVDNRVAYVPVSANVAFVPPSSNTAFVPIN